LNFLCRGDIEIQNSPSHAIYHILWKDEHCILTANFDTSLRIFDTRANKDMGIWFDAYDGSVYCLDYDGEYAVLCGMKYNFRVNLYDLRMPKKCVQMYFPSKKHTPYSPVYSIASDASQLFIVTDHDLRVHNFDADWAQIRDYSK
jgi:F-box/WD-40 domain protein 4